MSGVAVSVIVPTFNRRERLALVLQALSRQTTPPESFEAVVVDDGSTDGTDSWLAAQRFPFRLRLIRQQNAGPAAARNAGVGAAAGRLVLFLDDDVVPEPQLIAEHLRSHQAEPGCGVIGTLSSLPSYRQPWVAWEQEKVARQYRAMLNGIYPPTYRQFWTGNASVERSLVLEAGGFDGSYKRAEDIELAARLAQRGVRFRFNPAASGLHHAERSLASWEGMHLQYGRLEMAIHGRFGEEIALTTLANNWHGLHPATRALVSACSRSRPARVAASWTLRASIMAVTAAGAHRVARVACSLLANVNYWEGVRQVLGTAGLRAIFRRQPGMDAGTFSHATTEGPKHS